MGLPEVKWRVPRRRNGDSKGILKSGAKCVGRQSAKSTSPLQRPIVPRAQFTNRMSFFRSLCMSIITCAMRVRPSRIRTSVMLVLVYG